MTTNKVLTVEQYDFLQMVRNDSTFMVKYMTALEQSTSYHAINDLEYTEVSQKYLNSIGDKWKMYKKI